MKAKKAKKTWAKIIAAKFSWVRASDIMGIGLLFGVVSIAYSTTVIIMGTDGWVPVVMVAPQAVLAVAIAAKKFSK